MSNEKMREEFEAWFWNEFHAGSNAALNWCLVFSVGSDGKYNGIGCHAAWLSWQASRAALCVELPRCWNDEQRDYRDDMVKSLDSAGVSHQ